MKKSGFTLSELLMTLGIIGIIAALVMPAMQKLMPDKTKVQYLKTYDTISTLVKNLASNSKLYPVCNQTSNASCAEHPLISLDNPLDSRFTNARYRGDSKLCSLMAYSLGVSETDISCSTTPYSFNAADYTNGFTSPSFTTQNGMRWRIVPQVATNINSANWTARYQTDIYVDIDPSNNNVNGTDNSCIYNADSCTNPDIFKFQIAADGKVVAADKKGIDYLKSRTSLTNKISAVEDIEIANNIIGQGFLYKDCNGNGGTCPAGQSWNEETESCGADGGNEGEKDDSDVTLTLSVERVRQGGVNSYPATLSLSRALDADVNFVITGNRMGVIDTESIFIPAGTLTNSNSNILGAGSPFKYSVSIDSRTFDCEVLNYVCTSSSVVSDGKPKYTLITIYN